MLNHACAAFDENNIGQAKFTCIDWEKTVYKYLLLSRNCLNWLRVNVMTPSEFVNTQKINGHFYSENELDRINERDDLYGGTMGSAEGF